MEKKIKAYGVLDGGGEILAFFGGDWLVFPTRREAERYIGKGLRTQVVEIEMKYKYGNKTRNS